MERCAAVVQAFFPGEEGAAAIAGVLSGRVNPSGRLPVTLPRSSGTQPYTYLHPTLGGGSEVTNLDPRPAAVFGHGLSYTTFAYDDFAAAGQVRTDGAMTASVRVTNTGDRPGGHVVQLYARDHVGSVTRPVAQLVGFRRVFLQPGQQATVEFDVPTTRVAFTGRGVHAHGGTRGPDVVGGGLVDPGGRSARDVDWPGESHHERLPKAHHVDRADVVGEAVVAVRGVNARPGSSERLVA